MLSIIIPLRLWLVSAWESRNADPAFEQGVLWRLIIVLSAVRVAGVPGIIAVHMAESAKSPQPNKQNSD
jgi:flagellar basal body-associated protein FliL